MELNDIHIFIELYKTRSISKTAEKLNYTQSNISTRLMKLEQEFNMHLFARTKSGLKALNDTERFYHQMKKLQDNLNDLYQDFAAPKPFILIGSTQLLSRLYYSPLLLLDEKNILSLYTSTSKKLFRDFQNKTYDLILTHTKMLPDKNNLCYIKTETLKWITSSSFSNDLITERNVIVTREKSCPLRNLSLEVLKFANFPYRLIEIDTLDLMLSFLHNSNSIALLPESFCHTDKDLSEYSSLPSKTMEIYLYCNENFKSKILSEYFIKPFSFCRCDE